MIQVRFPNPQIGEVKSKISSAPESRDAVKTGENARKRHDKDKEKRKERQTRAEDEVPKAERRLIQQTSTQPTAKKPKATRKLKLRKILEALKTAASFLSSVGSAEDVEMWLEDNGFTDEETIKLLQDACSSIMVILREKLPHTQTDDSPTTSQDQQQKSAKVPVLQPYYFYRTNARAATVLVPRLNLTFGQKISTSALTRKTIGFIMREGAIQPLMCAVSGSRNVADPNPQILDSEMWLKEVQEFAADHIDFKFQSDGWDEWHERKRKGDGFASHAEPCLMLWWALRMLGLELPKGDKLSVKKLHRLHKSKLRKNARLILSEAPCRCCKRFQNQLEMVTGITFDVHVVLNLGKLESIKDEKKAKQWPVMATLEADEEEEGELVEDRAETQTIWHRTLEETTISRRQSHEPSLPKTPKQKQKNKRSTEHSVDNIRKYKFIQHTSKQQSQGNSRREQR